jgi:hypothetical protein
VTDDQSRLMGLETEYALRVEIDPTIDVVPRSHRAIYEDITRHLQNRLPTAAANTTAAAKLGWFLGTGGAVWFESLYPTSKMGLIEGATPECRTVRSLLACQRAQDQLLGEAASECGTSLIKNCHDAFGNAYGA